MKREIKKKECRIMHGGTSKAHECGAKGGNLVSNQSVVNGIKSSGTLSDSLASCL